MLKMKDFFHAGRLLTLISIALLPISVQAENCTETPVGGQVYSLINAGSGQALDIYGGRRGNGANVIQWPYKASRNQQFLLTDLNNGYWSIKAEHSGRAVDVAGLTRVNGGNILQWDYHGGNNQQWQLERSSSGAYSVVSRHSGKAMSVSGVKPGGNVFQQSDSGSVNQLWYFNPVDGSCGALEPTQEPTLEPTLEPTPEPTQEPTLEPTLEPTQEPTLEPTQEPKQ
jgi:pectate lyase